MRSSETRAGSGQRRTAPASLIIASRNRPKLLAETIASILKDDTVPDEIVVIDQSDERHSEVEHAAAGLPTRMRYIWSRSVGLSRAKNEGIAAAANPILAFTDDDMQAAPGWVASLVGALEKAGPRAAATGRVLPGTVEKRGGFVPATVLDDAPAVYTGRLNRDVLAAGNMAVYRSAIEEIGGFDERLGAGAPFAAADDNDFGFRLLEAGYSIVYAPEALLYHRAWRGNIEYLPLRWRYGLGKAGYYLKHNRRLDRHTLRRMLRDATLRMVHFPRLVLRHPRRAAGDMAYLAGMMWGVVLWKARGGSLHPGCAPARRDAPRENNSRMAPVTVGIASIGRSESLSRCLDALLAGPALPTEIVVVDQSGGDALVPVIEKYRRAHPRVMHVRQARLGLSAARNAVLRNASEPLLAITDDDCVPDSHWVRVVADTLSGPAAPDAVTGRVLPLGPVGPDAYAVSTRSGTRRVDFREFAAPWHVGTGGNFAAKKESLERICGWDERLGVGTPGKAAEDMDLFLRLLGARAHIRYEPEALVYHEPQELARRIASRTSYGHGIGAVCGLMARRGDARAVTVFIRWLLLRGHLAAKAAIRGRWDVLREEALVLRGTAAGIAYALRLEMEGGP